MRVRVASVACGLAIIAFAFFAVHPKPTGGPVFRDFEAYYAAGSAWHFGDDPYSRDVWRAERLVPGVVATRDELLPFVGPPFGLPLWAMLARFSWHGATQIWETILSASLVALAVAAVILGGVRRAERATFWLRVFAALVFAAAFGPITSGIALGQVAIPACAAVALSPFALRGRRTIAKTLGIGLVAALQPNIGIALGARIVSGRTAVAVAGGFVLAMAGSALAVNGGLLHYARVLAQHSAAERNIAIQTTVGAIARAYGAPPAVAASIAIVALLAAVGIAFTQCASRRYEPDDRVLLASLALPLAWPFAHEHDFAIAFVPALVVVARARGAAWYAAAFGAVGAGVDWLGLAQRPSGALFTVFLAIGAGFALVAFAPREETPDLRNAAASGIAVIVAAAAAIGAANPLPTWPDALPPAFRVPLSFDAAHTWAVEQIVAGIARLDAGTATLRLLSLLATTSLWITASYVLRASRKSVLTERAASARSQDREKTREPAIPIQGA